MATAQKTHDNNKSSVFEKLPEDLRRRLDLAIIHRIPPTFQGLWMQFELARFGVSFSALYRYARRLRDRVNLAEAAELTAEDDAHANETIQKLLSRRLLELLLHPGGEDCTREIAALTTSLRKGARTALDVTRLMLDDRRLSEESKVARERLEIDRENLRLKARALEWAPKARTRPGEPPTLRLACSNDAPAVDPAPAGELNSTKTL